MSYNPATPIGSIYGIGIGSVAASVTNPAVVGSLATQGIIGSVALTNYTGSVYVVNGAGSFGTQGVLGSVAVSNFPTTQSISVSGIPSIIGSVAVSNFPSSQTIAGSVAITNTPSTNTYIVSGVALGADVYVVSGVAWTGIGSVLTTGSVNIAGTPSVQPLIGSIYGIGVGSVYASIGAPSTIGSLAIQGVIGSVAVTNFPASQVITGSVAISSAAVLGTSGETHGIWGMGSGTTAYNPVMIESGAAGAPQRIVVTNNTVWSGVGSTLVTGSVNIAGTPAVTQTGSVAITSSATITTQPLIGSLYGIGIGSIYVSVGAPATIGSLSIQSVRNVSPITVSARTNIMQPGSSAVLTASGTQVVILANPGAGSYADITAIHITNGGSVATNVFLAPQVGSANYLSYQIAANGGAVIHPTTPILAPYTNGSWCATLDVAVNRDVRVWVQAVKNI